MGWAGHTVAAVLLPLASASPRRFGAWRRRWRSSGTLVRAPLAASLRHRTAEHTGRYVVLFEGTVVTFTFARVGAAVRLAVEESLPQETRWWDLKGLADSNVA